ncbi:DUF1398 family protein [Sphingosinithalassobacter sp. CS137]|uniref:DUF1398 family protein n=1 Tax=Sphingosinithalassobacter sp. CS137 TaxID=2762748 RepID=UPI00165DE061|nr:DUF1398 family protein [Sphingosinithalassobacter sp. CS137]
MTPVQRKTAELCLRDAETGTAEFPAIVARLIDAGFDGYLVDLRAGTARYYDASGDSVDVAHRQGPERVEACFTPDALQSAIREAQTKAPGYSYPGFCAKAAEAGCAGYLVSFPGRRVLYFGRTGDTHVEHFPTAD